MNKQLILKNTAEKNFSKYVLGVKISPLDNVLALAARQYISFTGRIIKNKIVFVHYDYKYQCNPKYICEELLRQHKGYDIVYAVKKDSSGNVPELPKGIRAVEINTYEFFRELATARLWVDNALNCPLSFVPKKHGQVLINTWHGSLGLKKITGVPDRKWQLAAKTAGRITNFMISNSAFETEVFRSTYWNDPKVRVVEFGHPRNDILFCDKKKKAELKRKVCRHFGVDEDTDLILYAPTFRNSGSTEYYDIDIPRVLAAAKERFGGSWKMLCRYHIKVADKMQRTASEDILDGNSYEDIQELMTVCKIGITDYSSWICDQVLGSSYGFIYAPDLDEYDSERGFYYPLQETPFPIARDNDELINNILGFDSAHYERRRQVFLKTRGCHEDGKASKRTVKLINKIMGKTNYSNPTI